jgi:hypothetical protein
MDRKEVFPGLEKALWFSSLASRWAEEDKCAPQESASQAQGHEAEVPYDMNTDPTILTIREELKKKKQKEKEEIAFQKLIEESFAPTTVDRFRYTKKQFIEVGSHKIKLPHIEDKVAFLRFVEKSDVFPALCDENGFITRELLADVITFLNQTK